MSTQQLAAATKIPCASLRLLEEDRFDALPGPVFAKGFLRCCARALALEPDAVMELLYEQERALLHARRRERNPPSESRRPRVLPRLPAQRRRSSSAPFAESRWRRLVAALPSASVVLWVLVAVLVAIVVLAAFNLMGAAAVGQV